MLTTGLNRQTLDYSCMLFEMDHASQSAELVKANGTASPNNVNNSSSDGGGICPIKAPYAKFTCKQARR